MQELTKFPCGKTLSEGFACDSPECFTNGCIQTPAAEDGTAPQAKKPCAGCDADADCNACQGAVNNIVAKANIEAL